MEEKTYSQIRYWVDDLPKNGRRTFPLEEAIRMFPQKRPSDVKSALSRLAGAGKVQSVWRGFYAIVLPEYGSKGIVPPTEYIDQLLTHLGNDYYVALLSAARQWGASHQSPQVFQFVCTKPLRKKVNNQIELEPVVKSIIPSKYLTSVNVRSGSIRVSSPELTAVDLLLYPYRIGGLSNAATVLSDMADELHFDKIDADFFDGVPPAVIQRLGLILENVAGEAELADELFAKAKSAGLSFRETLLRPGKTTPKQDLVRNGKWRVIVNAKPEADI